MAIEDLVALNEEGFDADKELSVKEGKNAKQRSKGMKLDPYFMDMRLAVLQVRFGCAAHNRPWCCVHKALPPKTQLQTNTWVVPTTRVGLRWL